MNIGVYLAGLKIDFASAESRLKRYKSIHGIYYRWQYRSPA